MSSEEEKNKALARRFLEATARGDLDAMDEMMAPEFVDRSLMPGQEPEREGYKRSVAEMDAPVSHQRVTIEDQIAEGDKVLSRATFRGVHDQGEFLGMPPHRRGVELQSDVCPPYSWRQDRRGVDRGGHRPISGAS